MSGKSQEVTDLYKSNESIIDMAIKNRGLIDQIRGITGDGERLLQECKNLIDAAQLLVQDIEEMSLRDGWYGPFGNFNAGASATVSWEKLEASVNTTSDVLQSLTSLLGYSPKSADQVRKLAESNFYSSKEKQKLIRQGRPTVGKLRVLLDSLSDEEVISWKVTTKRDVLRDVHSMSKNLFLSDEQIDSILEAVQRNREEIVLSYPLLEGEIWRYLTGEQKIIVGEDDGSDLCDDLYSEYTEDDPY